MDIDLEELRTLEDPLIVDVRSPGEFEEDHLPGAINLPVLTNDQRDRVGTIHNQESTFEARKIGAKRICENVPGIIDEIDRRLGEDQPLVLYCWRGGQRSQSLAIILARIGYPVYRLRGGYKQYRRQVHEYLTEPGWSREIVAIYGYTGAGKTHLLDRLAERGTPVLDLENAASHRGSAFGSIGLEEQPSQKAFENQIYRTLKQGTGTLFTEGESRRIGRRTIPGELFDQLTSPPRVWLETPREQRARRILDQYPWPDAREELIDGVADLKERLGGETVRDVQEKLRRDEVLPAIQTLLAEYYDPAYAHSCPGREEFDLRLDGTDLEAAADRLLSRFPETTSEVDPE